MTEFVVSHDPARAGEALLDFYFAVEPPNADSVATEAAGPLWVPLPALHGDVERWISSVPVAADRVGEFTVHRAGELLALSAWRPVTAGSLASETRRLYRDALSMLAGSDCPHLLRVWNYVPDINGGCGEEEPYKRFCAGRAAAIEELGMDPTGLPAASALGSPAGAPLQLTFLAGRRPGRHLENPRQQSAYHYPSCYGRAAPAFARATLHGRRLMVSGTAAIIGHESQFAGQVDRQLRCAVDNLLLLMDHACAEADARRVTDLHVRVYLRHPEHLDAVREALAADLPNLASAIYLQADVCRRELLVELEATGIVR